MWLTVFGIAVIAHGIITGVIWGVPLPADAPFDPANSWLFGPSRPVAATGGLILAAIFIVAGITTLSGASWWPWFAVITGTLGVVFMVIYFDKWLIAGVAISAAIAIAGLIPLLSRG